MKLKKMNAVKCNYAPIVFNNLYSTICLCGEEGQISPTVRIRQATVYVRLTLESTKPKIPHLRKRGANFLGSGAPGAIPTRDLPLRRRTLYAAELREHMRNQLLTDLPPFYIKTAFRNGINYYYD